MSTQIPSQPRLRLTLPVLLGLRDSADPTDWTAIRMWQVQAAARNMLPLFIGNLVAAAIAGTILTGIISSAEILAWIVSTAGLGAAILAFRRRAGRKGSHILLRDQLRGTVVEAMALALVWALPVGMLAAHLNGRAMLGLWIVIALLMTAATIGWAVLPLAGATFLTLTGMALALLGWWALGPLGAVVALAFTGMLIASLLHRCWSLMMLRANEAELSERDETVSLLLREFNETDADWLWETDAARRVIGATPRFAHSVGLDPVSINGMPLLQVLAGASWETGTFTPELRVLAERLKGREAFRDLPVPIHSGGETRWWEMSASPRYDDDGTFVGFRGVCSDVTQARESADQISRLARFDTLTGLPNRLFVHERLASVIAQADQWSSRYGLMMIDLDRFKAVNDTLGHPVGDRLLARVSERLKQLMGPGELCGRLGGDEFAVVVADVSDLHQVEALAQQIIDGLSRPYEVDNHTLYIGASVGIAIGPRDGRSAETLIRSADLALYRSKEVGGGVVHSYEPHLHVQAEERRVLEIALRQALVRDELFLDYQPVVAGGTGLLCGFEALLRWRNPQFGLVSPMKFVPLAEEARLIAPIGEWVLRTACDEAASWPDPIRVAVNVSPEQLLSPDFVRVVASALASSGLPPSRLELEVTESVFMREGTCAVQVLERVLDLGVRLSLDDFGTGYSSLGYLSRTRFSSIKIDRSFVQSASKGERESVAIIRAVVALAQSLGMATTAEGVETEAELAMVQGFGCTKVQGYYFGRPLPVEEARQIAQTRGPETAAAA